MSLIFCPATRSRRCARNIATLLDGLYQGWFDAGLVSTAPDTLDFWGKLLSAYEAGVDYFQPMDISLPGDRIHADTPFHIGPAVFDMLTAGPLLHVVEQLDRAGVDQQSDPARALKPPAKGSTAMKSGAHIDRNGLASGPRCRA